MALPLVRFRRRGYALRPLDPADCEALATLHAEAFARGWSEDEFATLLGQDTVFGFAAVAEGQANAAPVGFVLAREAADEAEILTVTVSRRLRRRGLGRALMDAVLRRLHTERATALFLEVDETNLAAIALYRRLGFREVGRRPDYYQNRAKGRTNALTMRRDLR